LDWTTSVPVDGPGAPPLDTNRDAKTPAVVMTTRAAATRTAFFEILIFGSRRLTLDCAAAGGTGKENGASGSKSGFDGSAALGGIGRSAAEIRSVIWRAAAFEFVSFFVAGGGGVADPRAAKVPDDPAADAGGAGGTRVAAAGAAAGVGNAGAALA